MGAVEQGERKPADRDARQIAVRVGDAEILVSWHAPSMPPEGQAHGNEGSVDGQRRCCRDQP